MYKFFPRILIALDRQLFNEILRARFFLEFFNGRKCNYKKKKLNIIILT